MGDFTNKVRKGDIPQPTQKSFDPGKWGSEFATIQNPDMEDQKLVVAGFWFYDKFQKIRGLLPDFILSELDIIDRKKVVIANLNRSTIILDEYQDEVLKNQSEKVEARKDKLFSFDELLQVKFEKTTSGISANPDAIVTAYMDGAELPLKYDPGSKTQNDLTDLALVDKCINFFTLGQLYSSFEEFWASCLWLGWEVNSIEGIDVLRPADNEIQIYRAISEHRRQMLILQQKMGVTKVWESIRSLDGYDKKTKVTVRIGKDGGSKSYSVLDTPLNKDDVPFDIWMKSSFFEFYFGDLLSDNFPNFSTINIEDLINAWETLSSLYEAVSKTFPKDSSVQKINKLLQYSPQIKLADLCEIIKQGCKCDYPKAKEIIRALTFSGELKGELWCRPIVEIDTKNRIIAFLPVKNGHQLRTIELWMKFGGIDLSERGELFEKYCLKEINEFVDGSEHCSKFVVSKNSFKMSDDVRSEQIDAVIIAGKNIFIGEAKCKLYPTDAIEIAHYISTLKDASKQAERKGKFVEKNKKIFLSKFGLGIDQELDEYKVFPFILVNQPYLSGLHVENIPVTDLMILRTYITQGFYDENAVMSTEGEVLDSYRHFFYKTNLEAEENLAPYLSNPPQIHIFRKYFRKVVTPLPFMPEIFGRVATESCSIEVKIEDILKMS